MSHDTEDDTISRTQQSASIVIYHRYCVDRLDNNQNCCRTGKCECDEFHLRRVSPLACWVMDNKL